MYYYLSKILTPIILPVNFIIILLIITFFIKKLKKIFYFFLFLLFFISVVPIGNFLTYHFLEKSFLKKENNKNFDSILILGGDERRILHGIALLKFNPDAKIIFSGGTSFLKPSNKQIATDERKEFLLLTEKLLKKEQVVVLDRSRNTIENLNNFKKLNNKFLFQNTVLVTDTWHYKRAMLIAKSMNLNLKVYQWRKLEKPSFLQYYQTYDFLMNLMSFNRFFREFYGIVALNLF